MRNRGRILEAAREVFATRGLGATMDDIAHHAGVGVGTVYRRFPDKELLIDALFEERIGTLVGFAQDGLAHEDPWEGLALFLERAVAEQAADRGLKELLLGTAHGRERVADARERLAPVVGDLVRRGQEAGAVREDLEPTDMPLMHLMLGATVDFTREIAPDAWQRYLGIVLDGLRPRRERPTPLRAPALGQPALEEAMHAWHPRR